MSQKKKSSLKGQLELWVAEKKSKEGIPEEGMTCTRKRCVHGTVGRPRGKGEDGLKYVGAPGKLSIWL